jgi:glycosyltransferase involved in cell wall biosynthesis
MRIIHCAPFNIFTKTGGSLYANPVKISHGFVQNGHYVHNFDYRDTSRYHSWFRNKKNGSAKMNESFRTLVDEINPDLIIFGHAELIDEETFFYIEQKNIRTLYWYNDIPLQEGFKEIAHQFDAIFTTAGGALIDDLRNYNAKSFFLPNLVDINVERYRAYENSDYGNDLLFTGRADSERAGLIDYLENQTDADVRKKFLGRTKESVVIGDRYLQEIADSKICLNHNRDFTLKYRWYTSDRLMHILGNGAFCLSTPIIGGEEFFEDKLEYYNSYEELNEKINFYLQHENERIEKARWLYERTHALFNVKRVSAYMLDILNEEASQLKQYEWYHD